jgi:hypothetical protein
MKFIPNDVPLHALHVGHEEKGIEETVNTKFLGLHIDNHLY